MKLQDLRKEILDTIYEAIKNAINEGKTYAVATVDTNDGYIDLMVNSHGYVDAIVAHDNNRQRERASVRIEAFCEAVVKELKWSDVKKDVKDENAPTFEEEYARRGESLFTPSLQWHRI